MSEDPRKKHPLERKPRIVTPEEVNAQQAKAEQGPRRIPIRYEDYDARLIVTYILIAINVFIFGIGYVNPALNDQFIISASNFPPGVLVDHEFYRLFTAMFLHGGLNHLFFNMIVLYVVGQRMEPVFGHVRFGVIYLLGGLAGSLFSVMFGEFMIASIGASGAVFAVWVAEAMHLYRHRDLYGPMAIQRLRMLSVVMVMNLVFGVLANLSSEGPGIDNWGHIGGLVGGAILTYLIGPKFMLQIAHDRSFALLRDTRPLVSRYGLVALYGIGLIILLAVAIVTVPS